MVLSALLLTAVLSEHGRVQTQLEATTRWLAEAPMTALDPAQRVRRTTLIAELALYTARGEYPTLDAPGPRTPRFRDPEGRWCAVGDLLVATGQAALAREYARDHEYAHLPDLDDARLDAWAAASGVTRTELAVIQPEYGFEYRCNGWGNGDGDCPQQMLRGVHRLMFGVGAGGGESHADGHALTYFLWGADVRYALAPWLAIGIGSISARLGPDATALAATPLVELSRWHVRYHTGTQWHLDLGVTAEHVYADAGPRNPTAAQVAFGVRFNAPDVAEVDLVAGAEVALADGFVIDDRVSAGSVLPFVRVSFGYRP